MPAEASRRKVVVVVVVVGWSMPFRRRRPPPGASPSSWSSLSMSASSSSCDVALFDLARLAQHVNATLRCAPLKTCPPPQNTDNPLPVGVFQDASAQVTSLPFRAHVYFNMDVASRGVVDQSSITEGGVFADDNHQCGFTNKGSSMSNDRLNVAQACANAGFTVAGAQASQGQEIWCGNVAKPKCPPSAGPVVPCPGNKSETCGGSWVLETWTFTTTPGPPPDTVGLSVAWSFTPVGSTVASTATPVPIPTDRLTPTLSPAEAQRDALQRGLASGWGPWLHDNMLAVVKLPEAATITTQLCQVSTNTCASLARPDGQHQDGSQPDVRVGLHAFDRSYVQFYFGDGAGVNANVSVEYSVSGAENAALELLVTPVTCGGHPASDAGACDDFEVRATGRYVFFRAGTIQTSSSDSNSDRGADGKSMDGKSNGNGEASSPVAASLTFSPGGFQDLAVYGSNGSTASSSNTSSVPPALHLPLRGGLAVALSTEGERPDPTAIATRLAAAAAAEQQLLETTFGADRAGEGQAVKAAAMWTLVSTPAENAGAPFLPVSRAWNFAPSGDPDFSYAIFDWDNLFASLIVASGAKAPASSNGSSSSSSNGGGGSSSSSSSSGAVTYGGFEYAVSNLFQVVKSKTAAGFVPNYAVGAWNGSCWRPAAGPVVLASRGKDDTQTGVRPRAHTRTHERKARWTCMHAHTLTCLPASQPPADQCPTRWRPSCLACATTTGGSKSTDRTEPPVGARVTLDLVNKFGADAMRWAVEVSGCGVAGWCGSDVVSTHMTAATRTLVDAPGPWLGRCLASSLPAFQTGFLPD
jgi:hypothetical protein